ncbi:hypothetical protein FOL47_002333 [Perkinsus chesapeaki]|uniref:Uncharacterized protein n=1 Tax=Perkinsus chesapeaki TaxID=330153 RepID=A0A7J6MDZ2_PERCH|nr:hypothetical protein FOL47_002333 [Perkinsus chesapeaki]
MHPNKGATLESGPSTLASSTKPKSLSRKRALQQSNESPLKIPKLLSEAKSQEYKCTMFEEHDSYPGMSSTACYLPSSKFRYFVYQNRKIEGSTTQAIELDCGENTYSGDGETVFIFTNKRFVRVMNDPLSDVHATAFQTTCPQIFHRLQKEVLKREHIVDSAPMALCDEIIDTICAIYTWVREGL